MPVRKPVMFRLYECRTKGKHPITPRKPFMFTLVPYCKAKARTISEAVLKFWRDGDGVPADNLYIKADGSSRYTHFKTWYERHHKPETDIQDIDWL